MCAIPGLKAGASLREACERMVQAFRAGGIGEPQADARILAAHALDLTRAQLIAQADRALEAHEVEAISSCAARRLVREPVSRIVGTREFWGLQLTIDPSVLDPRPETETVVELALDWIATRHLRNEQLRVLDIGTGSGALLLALLSEPPAATGVATDVSAAALRLARGNARRLGLADRCGFVVCDFLSAVRGPFDLVVSNPPYISSAAIPALSPEVCDHDPRIALDGGDDGLKAYRTIAADVLRVLRSRGRLIVELGQGQAESVSEIVHVAGLAIETPVRPDLAGIGRALCATAP